MMGAWFTINQIDEMTFCISENNHWEQTRCYLLLGRESALLIDTGLGVESLSEVVRSLTDLPILAVPTHIHWDHIGGLREFPKFCCHRLELPWLQGEFPLPDTAIHAMLSDRCPLPADFDLSAYRVFQGTPSSVLEGGEWIDLGGRRIQVLHTPGHAPGHLCFWEPASSYLFTGDLVYEGTLYAHYPSTDPEAYLQSLEAVSLLPAARLFPGHHTWGLAPDLLIRVRDSFRQLKRSGLLCHGTGRQEYEDWAVLL